MISQNIDSDFQLFSRALAGAAQLVALHGDEFLPAYICIEEELEKIKDAQRARDRARTRAQRTT